MKQLLAALMLAGLALLGGAGPAVAHNELIGSDPPEGATVASSPARVLLIFDLPVRPGFSTVTVTGPDRTQWQAGAPSEDGATVSSAVRPLGPAGQYTIAYQVLSADGHPVRGAVRFTLANPGPGVAVAQNQPGSAGLQLTRVHPDRDREYSAVALVGRGCGAGGGRRSRWRCGSAGVAEGQAHSRPANPPTVRLSSA